MPTNPVLVIHGGAWAMPDDMVDAPIRGANNALAAGWRVFERGGSTPDAVALGQNPRSATNTSGHAAYAVAILSVGKAAL